MGYCILPDGGLGVLSTILEVGLTLTFQDWQTGRNDKEWLPCYGGGDGVDRACAVSRSAGRQKEHPTITAANEGCFWSPLGSPGSPGSPGTWVHLPRKQGTV